MPLFLTFSEIYGRKVSKWWKIRNFFELFGPPCRNALADLDGSTPEYAQVCALHIVRYLASLRKIEMAAVLCTNETTSQCFKFLTPPPPALQGPMGTTGGEGTSADIVPTQIIFGVDPCKRCWDIAPKPPKCKNSPLTPIVTKISFAPFSARVGPPTPKGEKTRPDPGYARMQTLAWIGPRVVEKSLTEQNKQKKYSKTNTSPIALTSEISEWRVIRLN